MFGTMFETMFGRNVGEDGRGDVGRKVGCNGRVRPQDHGISVALNCVAIYG